MKDVKVYDGSGWQSLKGPPGPSEPSADAGNAITKGSDGLLYAPARPEGVWVGALFVPSSGFDVEVEMHGQWSVVGVTKDGMAIVNVIGATQELLSYSFGSDATFEGLRVGNLPFARLSRYSEPCPASISGSVSTESSDRAAFFRFEPDNVFIVVLKPDETPLDNIYTAGSRLTSVSINATYATDTPFRDFL